MKSTAFGKFTKRIICLTLCAAFCLGAVVSNAAFSKSKANDIYNNATLASLSAKSYAAVYNNAGIVVVESDNSTEHYAVGNMTKLMTLYLTFEALANGKTTLETKFLVSAAAQNISNNRERVFLDASKKEKITVQQAIEAICIGSANDAAYALAEHIAGGTEADFVELMNQKAAEFGMENTVFLDSTGIKIVSDGQYSCARDMAVLSYMLVTDYPEVLEFTSLTNGYFQHSSTGATSTEMITSNALMSSGMLASCDGLLVGYSNADLYAEAATADIDGERICAVVIGEETAEARAGELKFLLEYTATHFDIYTTDEPGTYVRRVSIKEGKSLKLKTCTGNSISYLYSSAEKPTIEAEIVVNDTIVAPVNEGDIIGVIKYTKVTKDSDGNDVRELIGTVDLLAQESVERANWFVLLIRKILTFLGIGDY